MKLSTEIQLETKRLILKILDDNFAEEVLNYYKRNTAFLQEWEPSRDPEFYTIDYQRDALSKESAKIAIGETFRVWLYKKGDPTNKIVGSIGLNNIVYGAFLSCHLGYKLDHNEINFGYMTEALKKVIEFAFSSLGLHRIEANILPRNLCSLRVVQKLGFYNEGLAKNYLRINGQWQDHIHMVLLNNSLD